MAVARGHPAWHAWVSAWWTRRRAWDRHQEARGRVGPDDAVALATAAPEWRPAVAARAQAAASEQAPADLAPACRQVLESLRVDGAGRTVFGEHPEVPMDNHAAARAARGPVVGRQNDDGRGAVGAGPWAAVMCSVLATLRLGGLHAQQGWTGSWSACADPSGQAAAAWRRGRAWTRTEAARAAWPWVPPGAAPPVADRSEGPAARVRSGEGMRGGRSHHGMPVRADGAQR